MRGASVEDAITRTKYSDSGSTLTKATQTEVSTTI
jgi:hypothetical protein